MKTSVCGFVAGAFVKEKQLTECFAAPTIFFVRSFCQRQFGKSGRKSELSEKLSEDFQKKESDPVWDHSPESLV